jgi:hypothetical protein
MLERTVMIATFCLVTSCGSAQQDSTAAPANDPAPVDDQAQTEAVAPSEGMAVERGTATATLDFGHMGPGARPILMNLVVGTQTTTHEIGQTEGACVLPVWTRDVIDPDGQAAGAILSFRCRHSGQEDVFRLVQGTDVLEVLRATRPTAIEGGRPRGQGDLVFERVATIPVPADVQVVVDQGPPMGCAAQGASAPDCETGAEPE